jgi:hypothetical protein
MKESNSDERELPPWINEAYAAGMPKECDLEDRKVYSGISWNATKAMWIKELNSFVYLREKWGHYLSRIPHPESNDGFDLFLTYGEEAVLETWERELFDERLSQFISKELEYMANERALSDEDRAERELDEWMNMS